MHGSRLIMFAASAAVCLTLTGCDWSVTVKKTQGKPATVEGKISGKFPPPPALVGHGLAAVNQTLSANDLYIDTSGTDFVLDASGSAAIMLLDGSGHLIAAQSFPWTRQGTKILFSNSMLVQSWLNQYPSAVDVQYKLTMGNTPADGMDHYMSSTVIYSGTPEASASATFAAECMGPAHRRVLCSGF